MSKLCEVILLWTPNSLWTLMVYGSEFDTIDFHDGTGQGVVHCRTSLYWVVRITAHFRVFHSTIKNIESHEFDYAGYEQSIVTFTRLLKKTDLGPGSTVGTI